ncbi:MULTISPECIES: class F sortase [Streptomyces]|uniref:Putative secreted protein n=1 Tax=Streptomyces albus (strain ATCC 21838 / DSM 41398 / FERM P-419 / JCM 4703 / NBRC 107858) TaxID=1081613 RepID=A0A0B5F9M5_STRA4|nr:class F sortase [Streptomyces sp. SCSIO ZS0520]AJE87541.1 putative secreted protein [Streptomyces albus]AOU81844.1 putative secreted protein [Streptomyces albus]
MSSTGSADGGRPTKKRAPWGVMALVLLAGVALIRNGSGEFDSGPPQPASADTGTERASGGGAAALPFAEPDRVRIDAIRVNAPLMPVGIDKKGWIEAPPPEEPNLAGWFTSAVTPGEKGTAVVVGHVDNSRGPAVFFGLGALKKGNHIDVRRKDGKTAEFEVYGIEVFEKDDFPGAKVYGGKGRPELRVITCGGGYSKESGYDGNVVVFARMVSSR